MCLVIEIMDSPSAGTPTQLIVRGRVLEIAWWGPAVSSEPPIVLLHEGLGSVATWRDVPAALAERTGCRVMAYSRFGHGASDPLPSPRAVSFMHEEARLLPEILDAAGIATATLLGHSDGGSIALIAAAESASRVHALILEAPHVFVEDLSVQSIEQIRTTYFETDMRERLGRYHADADAVFLSWNDVWLHADFRDWNLEDYLPRVTCPVLLIQGERDEYGTLRQVETITTGVTGSVEALVLPQCGHSPHRDQRDHVIDAMAAFVSRVS